MESVQQTTDENSLQSHIKGLVFHPKCYSIYSSSVLSIDQEEGVEEGKSTIKRTGRTRKRKATSDYKVQKYKNAREAAGNRV